jgi:hypothetical protein
MTHTLGIWFVDEDESDFTVSTDHGQQICRVLSADDFPCLEEGTEEHMNDEARANARLIAAAPDLLAALRDAAETIDSLDKQGGTLVHPTPRQLIDATNVVIRAAIAKAEGKS